MRGHWCKTVGHARWRLPDAWLETDGGPERLRRTAFPRRPRIEPGDRLVLYAAGWKRVFAVAEVTTSPTDAHAHPTNPGRWPWSVDLEPLIAVPRLENAPPLEVTGIPPRSMSQQSHIRLTPEQYERAVEAIGSVAR